MMNEEILITKKPKIERRAYYSEKITNPTKYYKNDLINYKNQTVITRYQKEKSIPIIHALKNPEKKTLLHPAITWINYNTNLDIIFPERTIQPKIQILNIAPSGQIPREVEVERRKRQYAKENIQQILKRTTIETWKLLPIYFVKNVLPSYIFDDNDNDDRELKNKFHETFNLFPLEWFDDTEYDCMNPNDWLNLGRVSGDKQYSIPGQAFLPNPEIINNLDKKQCEQQQIISVTDDDGNIKFIEWNRKLLENLEIIKNHSYHWSKVAVIDYDDKKMRWLVTDLNTKIQYNIPRIYLMFFAEDPSIFIERLQMALIRRDEIENFFKFQLIVECMILTGIRPPDDHIIKRIFNLTFIHKIKQSTIQSEAIDKLEIEVKLNYQTILAQFDLIYDMLENSSEYKNVKIPTISIINNTVRIPTKSIPIPFTDFKYIQNFVHKHILYNILSEPLLVMDNIIDDCLKINDRNFFNLSIIKSIQLNDFQSTQNHIRDMTINFLTDSWIIIISRKMRVNLNSIIKGDFDIKCSDWQVYKVSKLYRMLSLIKQIMQTTIRTLVTRSIAEYCNILTQPCKCLLNIDDDYVWTADDLITSPFQELKKLRQQQYLFAMTISINSMGVFYSTNPNEFQPTILTLFDEVIYCSHFVRQIDSLILTNLIFSMDLYLSSIGLYATEMIEKRNLLKLCYTKALIPLYAYAKQYEQYIELHEMNIKEYIIDLNETRLPSTKIKDIILTHLNERKKLENLLPETICIGPFDINVKPLKKLLIDKRQLLANKVLDYFANRMNEKTNELIDEFQLINKRLVDRPISIESIFETKVWMETIPEQIPMLEDKIRKIFFEYEILDYFYYNLTHEDMHAKWNAYAWPSKINKQILNTIDMFDEETLKFLQIQINDISDFESRIENMNVQVHAYSMIDDYIKAIEFSIDIKKLWNTIEELIKRGELLNKRQLLFDEIELNLLPLHNTLENFQPYKILWLTAADFLKSKETWCGNPITNIDIDSVNNLMEKYENLLNTSICAFVELPKIQNVAQQFVNQICQFKQYVRVLNLVKQPSFLTIHWQEFIKRSKIEMKYNLTINFKYCIDKGIMEHCELIEEISNRAINEKEKLEIQMAEAERLRLEKEMELLNKCKNRRGRILD